MTNTRGKRKIIVGGAAVALIALVAVGSWTMALRFESPAQREAAAAAPSPGAITAEVRNGTLARVVSYRAKVVRDSTVEISLTPSSSPSVVTAAPVAPGASIRAGSVISEVNGRPIFSLPGGFPFYRSLHVGDSGPDVAQLQRGLTAAGRNVVDDGVFGLGTERAVVGLYEQAGYTAPSEPAPGVQADGDAADPPAVPVLAVPSAELTVVPTLPATATSAPSVGTKVGDDAKLTVQSGAVRLRGEVPPLSADLLTVGLSGSADLGEGVPVHIASIGTAADGATTVPVVATPDGGTIDEGKLGQEVTVTAQVQVVAAEALIVPSVAVASGGSGPAHVLVERKDGSFERLAVRELGQLHGDSAIEVQGTGHLSASDRVRVDEP